MPPLEPREAEILSQIRRKVFARYKDRLFRTERIMGGNDLDKLEWARKDMTRPKREQDLIAKALQNKSQFDRTKEVVDEDIAARLERDMEWEIRSAIENGTLKRQKLDKYAMRHMR